MRWQPGENKVGMIDLTVVVFRAEIEELNISRAVQVAMQRSEIVVAGLPKGEIGPYLAPWVERMVWSKQPAQRIEAELLAARRVVFLSFRESSSEVEVSSMLQRHPEWLGWVKLIMVPDARKPWRPPRSQARGSLEVNQTASKSSDDASLAALCLKRARPLRGRRLLILRQSQGALSAADDLRQWGAEVKIAPLLTIAPVPVQRQQLEHLDDYQWWIFTSSEAVRYAVAALSAHQLAWRPIKGKVAVVGPSSQRVLEEYGILADRMAVDSNDQEGLLRAFENEALEGTRMLWFTGDRNRPWLAQRLGDRGARVDQVQVYRNQRQRLPPSLAEQTFYRACDGILFSSSSVVQELTKQLDGDTIEVLRRVNAFSIGEQTTKALIQEGLHVAAEAPLASWDDLARTVARCLVHESSNEAR